MQILVGTGGWKYMGTKGDVLKEYSKIFDFVEVNSTFYSNPSLSSVSSWRSRVPSEFEFSVKCSRLVTHENSLLPLPDTMAEVGYMVKVCRLLRAECVVLQTPASLEVNADMLRRAEPIFMAFKEAGLTPVLEARNQMDYDAIELMREMGIVHSVDLTRGSPGYDGNVLYSRLFGEDRYSRKGFGEEEYGAIERRLSLAAPTKAYLAFHGIQMYRDAAGFKGRMRASRSAL